MTPQHWFLAALSALLLAMICWTLTLPGCDHSPAPQLITLERCNVLIDDKVANLEKHCTDALGRAHEALVRCESSRESQ